MLYFFVVIIIHVVNAQGCAMTVVAGCVKCGPATRNSEPGTTALAQTSASISSHCASQQEIRKYKSGLYCATFTCC